MADLDFKDGEVVRHKVNNPTVAVVGHGWYPYSPREWERIGVVTYDPVPPKIGDVYENEVDNQRLEIVWMGKINGGPAYLMQVTTIRSILNPTFVGLTVYYCIPKGYVKKEG